MSNDQFKILPSPRPETTAEEDRLYLDAYRETLTKLADILGLPGSPSLTGDVLEAATKLAQERASLWSKNVEKDTEADKRWRGRVLEWAQTLDMAEVPDGFEGDLSNVRSDMFATVQDEEGEILPHYPLVQAYEALRRFKDSDLSLNETMRRIQAALPTQGFEPSPRNGHEQSEETIANMNIAVAMMATEMEKHGDFREVLARPAVVASTKTSRAYMSDALGIGWKSETPKGIWALGLDDDEDPDVPVGKFDDAKPIETGPHPDPHTLHYCPDCSPIPEGETPVRVVERDGKLTCWRCGRDDLRVKES